MKIFMDKDFLLGNETSKILYHNYAEKMPIFDYHSHLSAKDICEDRKFNDIVEAWIVDNGAGDHYKWRAIREFGIDESYITGNKPNKEKFKKFAELMPYAIGNPLYHWSHLELKKYFDIDEVLSPETCDKIYDECNEKLKTLTCRKMLEKVNVNTVCTTDDPVDDLKYHKIMAQDKTLKFNVYPAFRPDKVMNIEQSAFKQYVEKLSQVVGYKIDNLTSLEKALEERVEYFDKNGCFLSDHSLEIVYYADSTKEDAEKIFIKGLKGGEFTSEELDKYKGYMLVFFGKLYNKYNWVQQYHIGAIRNNNKRAFLTLGPDTGFDSVNDEVFVGKLAKLMSKLEETNELAKTVLYCLNQRDTEVLAGLMNCFQDGKIRGKIQLGSAWWFNDHKYGMERQLDVLSQMGLLSQFVGMLTDSRSFLSYSRHEYFRRILCNKIGALIENGEYPYDIEFVGKIVENICFNNAKEYFKK